MPSPRSSTRCANGSRPRAAPTRTWRSACTSRSTSPTRKRRTGSCSRSTARCAQGRWRYGSQAPAWPCRHGAKVSRRARQAAHRHRLGPRPRAFGVDRAGARLGRGPGGGQRASHLPSRCDAGCGDAARPAPRQPLRGRAASVRRVGARDPRGAARSSSVSGDRHGRDDREARFAAPRAGAGGELGPSRDQRPAEHRLLPVGAGARARRRAGKLQREARRAAESRLLAGPGQGGAGQAAGTRGGGGRGGAAVPGQCVQIRAAARPAARRDRATHSALAAGVLSQPAGAAGGKAARAPGASRSAAPARTSSAR